MDLAGLKALIEASLREGVLENETTMLSRAIVSHLKRHVAQYEKDLAVGKGHWIRSFSDEIYLPMGNFRNYRVLVHVSFLPIPRNEHPNVKLNAKSAEFTPGKGNGEISIRTLVPIPFDERELAQYVIDLKDGLRHELEHAQQEVRLDQPNGSDWGTHHKTTTSTDQEYQTVNYEDLDSAKAYYLHPTEVEAFVMGAYKQAKMRKIPLTAALEEVLKDIYESLTDKLDPAQVKPLVDQIKAAWIDYAKKRLPVTQKTGLAESLLDEGVMDNLTTQLSRQIVNYLKQHGNVNSKGFIPSWTSMVGDNLQVIAAFRPAPEAGAELKVAAGEFNKIFDGYNGITLKIQVPQPFNPADLNKLIPDLKNVLRHELEHSQQNAREANPKTKKNNGVHYNPFGAVYGAYPDTDKMSKDGFINPEMAKRYYLHPVEIEAFVMGIYKQAKTEKKTFKNVLSSRLTQIYGNFMNKGMSRVDAARLIRDMKEAWLEYAAKRLPTNQKTGLLPTDDVIDSSGEVVAAESKKPQ